MFINRNPGTPPQENQESIDKRRQTLATMGQAPQFGPPGGFDRGMYQVPGEEIIGAGGFRPRGFDGFGGGGQFQTPGMVPEDFGQQFSGPQADDPRIQALQEALLNMVAARSGSNIGPPGSDGQRIVPFGEGM